MLLFERCATAIRSLGLSERIIIDTRGAVADVESGRMRGILDRVIDAIVDTRPFEVVLASIGRYAERLHKTGQLPLTVDIDHRILHYAAVYDTVNRVDVYRRITYCLNAIGRSDEAHHICETGIEWAAARGDSGAAVHLEITRGRLFRVAGQTTDSMTHLDRAVRKADMLGDSELIYRSTYERGLLAYDTGDSVLALLYYRPALHALREFRTRDSAAALDARNRLVTDIGQAFRKIGLPDTARNLHLAIYLTADECYARWTAAINLMALAIERRQRDTFHHFRAELEMAPLPARLLIPFLEELCDGYLAFDEPGAARDAHLRLARIARQYGLHAQSERAFQFLRHGVGIPPRTSALPAELPQEIASLAGELLDLCELPAWLKDGMVDTEAVREHYSNPV